jgi:predicted NBD/HSP70 family sugar kinase
MLTMPRSPSLNARFRRAASGEIASASERLILDLVLRAGVMSRADLTRACGLSGPGAKGLIDGLVKRGMLQLGPTTSKGRGQPSATVSLVAQYAYCFGLSITVDGFALTLADFSGRVVKHRSVRAFPMKLDQVAKRVKSDMSRMLEQSGIAVESVFGLCISMTGPFVGDGTRVNPPLSMPDAWAQTEVDTFFCEHTGQPVWIDNDANCAATAEAQFGIGREISNFVYLHFTDGFGGGIVQNGKLLRGSHGNAGELGRLFALTGVERPTLEGLRMRLASRGLDLPDLHSMLNAYDPAWPEIGIWIKDVRKGLTMVVAAITALLDPAAIVLGERLPRDLAQRLTVSNSKPARGED